MSCESIGDVLLSTVVRLPDGRLYQSTRRPYCDKWSCASCKAFRAHKLAEQLLLVAAPEQTLYVGRVPTDRHRTIEMAFKRRGGGGRLIVGVGDEHLHVADIDCLTPQRGTPAWRTTVQTAEFVGAVLRDPDLPITRGGRWVGKWKPEKQPTNEQMFSAVFSGGDERARFCHSFDIDPGHLRGDHTLPGGVEFLRHLDGCWEWWRINIRGKAPRGHIVPIEPSF